MNNITTMDVINLSPSTKTEAAIFAQKLIADVEVGVTNPLELAVKMKAIQDALDVVKEAIKRHVIQEAERYEGKTFNAYQAEMTIMEAGVKYDYESCGDPEWMRCNQAFISAKEAKDACEKRLKAMNKPMSVNDEETGEVVTVRPPLKTSTTTVKITLK